MPVALEHSLQHQARVKGYRKGSKQYNAYVYGTMNKLGLLSHNHAGNLGPDKLLKGKGKYEPTVKNVHGIHIGVVTVLILLVVWYALRGYASYNPPAKNGDGATKYVDTQSFLGWKFYQYNSLGAMAGVLNGESN